jgi:hypothetical protein
VILEDLKARSGWDVEKLISRGYRVARDANPNFIIADILY